MQILIKSNDIIDNNAFNLFGKKIVFENLNIKNDFYIGIRPEDISLENRSEITFEITLDLIEKNELIKNLKDAISLLEK